MLADETCNFLVFDFDNHDKKKENNDSEGANSDSIWVEDVNAMRRICRDNDVDVLVERSRQKLYTKYAKRPAFRDELTKV